ncbi:hypothetical protein PW683_38745 [Streptomyces niveus]
MRHLDTERTELPTGVLEFPLHLGFPFLRAEVADEVILSARVHVMVGDSSIVFTIPNVFPGPRNSARIRHFPRLTTLFSMNACSTLPDHINADSAAAIIGCLTKNARAPRLPKFFKLNPEFRRLFMSRP